MRSALLVFPALLAACEPSYGPSHSTPRGAPDAALPPCQGPLATDPFPRVVALGGELSGVWLAADLDGDGDTDLLETDRLALPLAGATRLLRNDGHGALTDEMVYQGRVLTTGALDVDGDGSLDLVGAAYDRPVGDRLELLLNDGHGNFRPQPIATHPGLLRAAVLVDVDGDGVLDVVASWRESMTGNAGPSVQRTVVRWYHRTPDRYEEGLVLEDAGSGVLAAGDLDGDGGGDLLVLLEQGGQRHQRILWHEGAGFVTDPSDLPELGAAPVMVDLDGDGRLDLVAGDRVLHNEGHRKFRRVDLPAPAVAGSPLVSVAVADLDGDGALDLVSRSDTELHVFRQDKASPLHFRAGRWPIPGGLGFGNDRVGLVLADLDGDGRPEALLTDRAGRLQAVSPAQLDLALTAVDPARTVSVGWPSRILTARDLDGDGRSDLVVVAQQQAQLLFGVDTHGFLVKPFSFASSDAGEVLNVAVDDLDGDGRPDLAMLGANGWLRVFRNNDLLAVQPRVDERPIALADAPQVALGEATGFLAADLDGDGDRDLIELHPADQWAKDRLVVLWNDGHARFSPPATLFQLPDEDNQIAAADLDGDGRAELVVGSLFGDQQALRILRLPPGGQSLELAQTIALPDGVNSLAAGDLDGDGRPELVTGTAFARDLPVTVLWNDGHGGFPRQTQHLAGVTIDALTIADVDGDGRPDVLAAGTSTGDVTWLRNDGQGGLVPVGRFLGGADSSVAVGDFDGRCGADVAISGREVGTIRVSYAGSTPAP